jgi:U-box domain
MDYDSFTSAPHHFLCPLTLAVMKEPIQNKKTGHTFEKAAILNWMGLGNRTCPLTRQPLQDSDFTANKELENEISVWKQFVRVEHKISGDKKNTEEMGMNVDRLMSIRNRVLQRREQSYQQIQQQRRRAVVN